MKYLRQGLRSTQITIIKEEINAAIEADMHPLKEIVNGCQMFAFSGSINKKYGTKYVDLTGRFPIQSLEGNIKIFVLYNYLTNAILIEPMKDATDASMIKAFSKQVTYLTETGFKPVLNIIGNVASKTIRIFLKKEDIKLQLVEPHNHQINAAERERESVCMCVRKRESDTNNKGSLYSGIMHNR